MMNISASREHEFCYGHRVVGHEGKCKHLHGHNGKVKFTIRPTGLNYLDPVGRVIDFSVIKDKLCEWLEVNWDHKMLLWEEDPFLEQLKGLHRGDCGAAGIVVVDFNPTAENLSEYLLRVVGRKMFQGMPVELCKVEFYETSKCSVEASL